MAIIGIVSVRVLEQLGMPQEGRLWQHEFFRDRARDILLYGILATEWQEGA